MRKELIAVIRERSASTGFKTDFFYYDGVHVKGVNKVLGKMVENFNKSQARKETVTGNYQTMIPFKTNGHLPIKYSFGCGNTHYLQQSLFGEIARVNANDAKKLPLDEVKTPIAVYAPHEVQFAQTKYNYQF